MAPCPSALLSQGGVWGGSSLHTQRLLGLQLSAGGKQTWHSSKTITGMKARATSLNRLWRNDDTEKLEKAFLRGKKCT